MIRRTAIALFALAAFGAAWSATAGVAAAASSRYVVLLRHGATATNVEDVASHQGVRSSHRYGAAVKGFSAALDPAQVAALRRSPLVDLVVPDRVVAEASGAVVPLASGDSLPPGIRRVGAATPSLVHAAADGPVAVLDTGLDMTNRDLNAVAGTNCIKPGAAPQDDNGHGTNLGGIIAARNNGTDVTGVAPGTPLYAVKVLDRSGKGTLSQILCGIDWVTSHAAALGIRVANASFSGAGANDGACGATNKDVEHRAICNSVAAGVTYVAAAGNGAQGLERTVPAAYPEVLTTTAMTDTDGLAGRLGRAPACVKGEADDRYAAYSNWAATAAAQAHVVSAPGTCVASDKIGGGTSVYWGTSQAAPHVAGAVALCLGSGGVPGPCAGLTPDAVIARIRADAANAAAGTGFTGDPVSPLSGRFYGYLVRADAY